MTSLSNSTNVTHDNNLFHRFTTFLSSQNIALGSHIFVIKITNYELLSIVLDHPSFTNLIQKCENIILQTLHDAGCESKSYIRHDNYIQISVIATKVLNARRLSYMIYYNIQLNLPQQDSGTMLECKITDAQWDGDLSRIQQLLCGLAVSKDMNYYVPFDNMAVTRVMQTFQQLGIFQYALAHGKFSFAYQPIIERVSGHIPYYECLLRIETQNAGIISVGPLMPLAEKIGMNNVIDQTVLSMVVNELKAAHHITLSVNISNSGILDPNLLDLAEKILSDKSVAQRLVVEITETSINTDFDSTKTFTKAMRDLGCRIALDDFGTGFTSFKQLQNFDIDLIKIDGTFIRDIVHNKRNQDLVLSLMDIAKQLGAKTVAEFVESGEIAKFLLDIKIDYMQGNFFSPAINYRSWDKS